MLTDWRRDHAGHATWRLSPRAWWRVLRHVWTDISGDHLSLISAGVAFYGLLAIFPALAVAVSLVGLVIDPAEFVGQLNAASEILPREVSGLLIHQASEISGSGGDKLGLAAVIGLLLALWSASRGVASLIEGLNFAYDVDEDRGWFKLNGIALLLTVVVIVGTLAGLLATVVIPAALVFLGLKVLWLGWVGVLRWPILIVGTLFGLSILYRFGPSRRGVRWQFFSPGAVLACALWLIATFGFSYYASNYGSYNQTFGALGAAIVMLLWLWLSSFVVLIGAELNAGIEIETAPDRFP